MKMSNEENPSSKVNENMLDAINESTQKDFEASFRMCSEEEVSKNLVFEKDDYNLANEEIEKDFDFGSASSRRESDGDSWETVSEEMRAEASSHQADGNCLCQTCEMKSLSISNRITQRSLYSKESLPENVSKIVSSSGTIIYIIGTAHFSKASQEDVAKTIQLLSPDIVMIELCSSRIGVLKLDEEALLEAAKDVSLSKLKMAIKDSGSVLSGIMQLLLLSMSAHITKQLGMAPGGEFRVATNQAKQIPGCRIVLGDRPIQATLGRAMASLSIFQKIKLGWHLIFSKGTITKEDVEKYKQKDMIAEMLAEMTGDFPELSKVFVDERDLYMAHMLEQCGNMVRNDIPSSLYLNNAETHTYKNSEEKSNNGKKLEDNSDDDYNNDEDEVKGLANDFDYSEYQPVVLGVVGIGHINGIIANIGKSCDVNELLHVPPPSFSSKAVKMVFKAAIVAFISWSAYSVISWVRKK
ncbi:traB domain-containing protein isoform X1 [Hydra vulgaris]|uniref:traB domain-containing protein isoform X1 n=1 Tax=Hydra vulgaris TaxID=6087 RepID=UPI0001925E58|nr:traB domain-containing protein-like [Hydra vulgaris]